MRRALIGVAVIAALAFFGISLRIHSAGGHRELRAERAGAQVAAPSRAAARRLLAGSPAPLAALHRQAGELIEGERWRSGWSACAGTRSSSTPGPPGAPHAAKSCRCSPPPQTARAGASPSSAPTSKTRPRRPRLLASPRSATRATRSTAASWKRSPPSTAPRRRSSSPLPASSPASTSAPTNRRPS